MKKSLTSVFWFVAVLAGALAAPEPREETVLMFENRKLIVTVPPGIAAQINKDFRSVVSIRMADPDEKISFSMTVLPDPEGEFMNARARKEKLVEIFNQHVPNSTEQGMQFEELEPRTGVCTYCVFTDARLIGKPKPPGEFMHSTIGVKAWPGVVAIFELLSQDLDSAEHKAMMTVLRESVQEKPVPLK